MLQSAETNGRKGGPATTARPAHGSGRSRPSIGQGLKQLGSLAFQERRVILLLRAMAAPGDAPAGSERHASPQPALREGFELLAREAIANGLSIFAPGSAFVNDDELAILSRLTLFQRPSQSGEWELANDFQKALKTCADELENEGRRLPPRPPLLEDYTDRHACFRIRYVDRALSAKSRGDLPVRRQPLWDGQREPEPGTLRARALEIVRRNPISTTAQFLAVGITHQYLSTLGKQGYVEKIGHGVYRYPSRLRKNEKD
ncbi:MAG: hypothetical protein E2586_14855 [Novosphingobium sp.]|nr:hypothetical protein [Novosphingobium sp.]